MAELNDGSELIVGNNLSVVLEDEAVALINSPCLGGSSIILTDAVSNGSLNVSHYIIPQEVTVAGFEEVVGDVDLTSNWGSLTSNSSVSSSTSLGQDSGVESDANPDVFLTFVDDSTDDVNHMALLAQLPVQEKGEVVVQKLYEMKDDFLLPTDHDDLISTNSSQDNNGSGKPLKVMQHQVVKLIFKESKDSCITSSDKDGLKEDSIFASENELVQLDSKKTIDSSITSSTPTITTEDEIELSKSKMVATNSLMYHCTECNTNFASHSNFKKHMEDHLTRLQNSCALCNREFDSKNELQEHIRSHFTKYSFVSCEICNKEFLSKAVLKRHKKQIHETNGQLAPLSHKCEVCNSVFSSKFSLKSHSAIHSTRKPYTCKECGATFTQNGSLQVHLRRHRGEKPFKCVICGNTFTRAHSLKVHMKTHTGEKPYSCEYCGACFVTSSHLTVHRRTHTGERPYSCNSCGATFITTSHLNVHRRLHTAGSEFNSQTQTSKASNCNGSPTSPASNNNPSTNGSLASNGSPVSKASSKQFTCTFCWASFDDLGHLRRHRRTVHRGSEKLNLSCKRNDSKLLIGSEINKRIVNGCS